MNDLINIPSVQLGVTKADIVQIASSFVAEVIESGAVLEVAEALSANENLIKEVKSSKEYVDAVRDELAKHGKGYTTVSGAKIELAEVGTKYDFYNCDDIELHRLEQQKVSSDEALKARQDFLKNIPLSGIELTNKETGEMYMIYPPSKSSVSSYKITLAK